MIVRAHPLNFGFLIGALIASLTSLCVGTAQKTSANQLVEEVMQNESRADTSDHSHWIYREREKHRARAR
jgi:hypothetical protein